MKCIQVDDAAYFTRKWSQNVPSNSKFSERCGDSGEYLVHIPDNNFEQALIDLGYDDVLDNYVDSANINTIPELNIASKNISDLTGIEAFEALQKLNCSKNHLTNLNLVKFNKLLQLDCSTNLLTSLIINNGSNENFTAFSAINNPNLTCILVDNAIYSTTNWVNIDSHANFSENCSGENQTYIPDDNFEQALIDLGYDDVLDDYVTTTTINTVTELNVASKHISDLTGIEDFVDLTRLECHMNKLTSLDLSKNINLEYLACHLNQLSTLDLSTNIALEYLHCPDNNITNLDVSKNTKLTYLDASKNELTSLNIGNNLELLRLRLQRNKLASLDISKNIKLTVLLIDGNKLTEFDVSNNTALERLIASGNQLTNLDLTKNNNLKEVACNHNQLTTLNIKNEENTKITYFKTHNNPNLNCIEVDDAAYSTANWTDIDSHTSFSEDCSDNGGGDDNMCVQASIIFENGGGSRELNFENGNYSKIVIDFKYLDNSFQYEINGTPIHDKIVELEAYEFSASTDVHLTFANNTGYDDWQHEINSCWLPNTNGLPRLRVTIDENGNVTMMGTRSTTATKLEEVVTDDGSLFNTITLNAANNVIKISNIDEDGLDGMSGYLTAYCKTDDAQTTYVPDNNFEQALIDLGYDDVLDDYVTTTTINTVTELNVASKHISDLTGIEDFVDLTRLECHMNKLTSLDLSKNINLEYLACHLNQLSTLDLSTNIALEYLHCPDNNITNLDVSKNTKLTYLDASKNELTSLNIGNNLELLRLRLQRNKLASLDISKNIKLTVLLIDGNKLTEFDVSNNTALERLIASGNQLTNLDLTKNNNLKEVACNHNQLTTLNIKNEENTKITYFKTHNNPNLNCIEVDDAAYSTANWTDIDSHTSFSEDCSDNGGGDDNMCVQASIIFENGGGSRELNFENGNYSKIVIDFKYLDNSFQYEINGTPIHDKIVELEAYEFSASTDVHLTFANNTGYDDWQHEINSCWLPNTNGLPRLRVTIDENGNVTMMGTRSTTATKLEEVVTDDGSLFNTITLNAANNVIKISNIDEEGLDGMSGDLTAYCKTDEERSLVNEKISLHPNPVINNLNLSVDTKATYFLSNFNGQVILKGELEFGNNVINIRHLLNGMYYINIQTKEGISSHKFIKQ